MSAVLFAQSPEAGRVERNGSQATFIVDSPRPLDSASRTHLALAKYPPEPRSVQPVESGAVVAIPQVGRLHHRYERRAA